MGVAIEKAMRDGGRVLRRMGIRVEALATVERIEGDRIIRRLRNRETWQTKHSLTQIARANAFAVYNGIDPSNWGRLGGGHPGDRVG